MRHARAIAEVDDANDAAAAGAPSPLPAAATTMLVLPVASSLPHAAARALGRAADAASPASLAVEEGVAPWP